jgi:hypothetical protein
MSYMPKVLRKLSVFLTMAMLLTSTWQPSQFFLVCHLTFDSFILVPAVFTLLLEVIPILFWPVIWMMTVWLVLILLKFVTWMEKQRILSKPIVLVTLSVMWTFPVSHWRSEFQSLTEEVIAQATVDMPLVDCKYSECLLGNFVSDAMFDQFPNTDITLMNDGGMRAGLLKGRITIGDVLTVLPFPNTVVQIPVTGRELKQILENIAYGRTMDDQPVASLGHWSGLKYVYNVSRPMFQKVVDIQIRDSADPSQYRPLDESRTYNLVTTDFTALGGDNIMVPREEITPGVVVFDVVERFIRDNLPVISPVLEGRITKLA